MCPWWWLCIEMCSLSNLDTYLWALYSGALDPLAQDLTPFTHTELTTCAIPHIAMVTDNALIEAAAFRRDTVLAALSGSLDLHLTLRKTHISTHLSLCTLNNFYLCLSLKNEKISYKRQDPFNREFCFWFVFNPEYFFKDLTTVLQACWYIWKF